MKYLILMMVMTTASFAFGDDRLGNLPEFQCSISTEHRDYSVIVPARTSESAREDVLSTLEVNGNGQYFRKSCSRSDTSECYYSLVREIECEPAQ